MRIRKIIKRIFLIIIIIICVAGVMNLIVINSTRAQISDIDEALQSGKADCILVLGASVTGSGPSPILAARLDKGLSLYEAGASDILLFSGDNGTVEYNEVQSMKDYALKNGSEIGLEDENIYLDYAGFSTYDSLYRAQNIFLADKIIIVTQRYHLYRALYIANRLGIDAVGVAADDFGLGRISREIREMSARIKDIFLTTVRYVPEVMGEPVPLTYPSTQAASASIPPAEAPR